MPSATPELPSPWREFLLEVDALLQEPVEVHCLGGFVVTLLYGLTRTTSDVDYIEISPAGADQTLQGIAGPDSHLHKKFGLYFQHVTVASLPESYDERLIEPFPNRFQMLRLLVVEPHDLALSKLSRNAPIDQADVEYLARTVPLSADLLRQRYEQELRPGPLMGDPEKHDRTLRMWLEAYIRPDP